jgi:hypothetical protein
MTVMEIAPIAAGLIVAMSYAMLPLCSFDCDSDSRVGTPSSDEVEVEGKLASPDRLGMGQCFAECYHIDELGDELIVTTVQ